MHLRSEQVLIDGGSVSHQAEVFLFHSTNTPGANPDDSATIKSAPGRELWPSRFAFTAPRWLPDADLIALPCAGTKKSRMG